MSGWASWDKSRRGYERSSSSKCSPQDVRKWYVEPTFEISSNSSLLNFVLKAWAYSSSLSAFVVVVTATMLFCMTQERSTTEAVVLMCPRSTSQWFFQRPFRTSEGRCQAFEWPNLNSIFTHSRNIVVRTLEIRMVFNLVDDRGVWRCFEGFLNHELCSWGLTSQNNPSASCGDSDQFLQECRWCLGRFCW